MKASRRHQEWISFAARVLSAGLILFWAASYWVSVTIPLHGVFGPRGIDGDASLVWELGVLSFEHAWDVSPISGQSVAKTPDLRTPFHAGLCPSLYRTPFADDLYVGRVASTSGRQSVREREYPKDTFWERRGFVLDKSPGFERDDFPLWPLALLGAVNPLMRWRRGRRRRLRVRRGLCRECGYDLRASSGCCPECGTPNQTTAPGKFRRWRMAARAMIALIVLSVAGAWTWLWVGMHSERPVHEIAERRGFYFGQHGLGPDWLDLAMGAFRYQRLRITRLELNSDGNFSASDGAALESLGYVESIEFDYRTYDHRALAHLLEHLRSRKKVQKLLLSNLDSMDLMIQPVMRMVNLRELSVVGKGIHDGWIDDLRGLARLDHLSLINTAMTDRGLADIAHLKSIQALNLSGTGVLGPALSGLAGLRKLRTLDLSGTPITNESLQNLSGCLELQTLILRNTSIGDSAVRYLTALTNLTSLDMSQTHLNDLGLKYMKSLIHLHELNISETSVNRDGLGGLAPMPQLWNLNVSDFDEYGLEQLKRLKNLKRLYVHSYSTDLGREMPGVEVFSY